MKTAALLCLMLVAGALPLLSGCNGDGGMNAVGWDAPVVSDAIADAGDQMAPAPDDAAEGGVVGSPASDAGGGTCLPPTDTVCGTGTRWDSTTCGCVVDQGQPPPCPATLDFDDGSVGDLAFGPQNHVLVGLTTSQEPVTSYTGDVVFSSGTLKALGEFAPVAGANPMVGTGERFLAPPDGDQLAPWLGEILLIPPRCSGTDITGYTVTVHFYIGLLGAIGSFPPHGAFLGSYGEAMTYYPDAVIGASTMDGPGRIINTLAEQKLAHTFTATEAADVPSHGLFLRLYVLSTTSTGSIPVRLSVDQIVWTMANR